MKNVLFSLIPTLRFSLKSRATLQSEILALRHQIAVLQKASKKRTRFSRIDRIFWVWLSWLWSDWSSSIRIVKPATVIAWHRKGFCPYWRRRSPRPGRPDTKRDIKELIRKISKANPTWGAPRIHSELLKLGIDISPTTVAKYMIRHRKPPSQTWHAFLDNHVKQLVSIDFLVVSTITFKVLFVFVILSHERRRVLHFNVTCGWRIADLTRNSLKVQAL
jgi:putative transposase